MSESFKNTRPDILPFGEEQWEGLEYMHALLHEEDVMQCFMSSDERVVLIHDSNDYSRYGFNVYSPADDLMFKMFEVDIFNSAAQAQLRTINKPRLNQATEEAVQEWCDLYESVGMDIPTGQEIIEFERIFENYMKHLKQVNGDGEARLL
jgi:hypothetical protein